MIQQSENNHPAHHLFELLLREIRIAVQQEFALLREDLKGPTNARPTPPTAKRLLSLREAANELSLSIPTVRRLIDRGLLRPNRAVRHLRFPREELDRFARGI